MTIVMAAASLRRPASRVNASPRIRLGASRRVLAQERARFPGRLAGRILADHALPHHLRARVVAKVRVREPDPQQRVGRTPRRRRHLDDAPKLFERVPIVALHVVRLSDPVLRVCGQWMSGVGRDEVQKIEHRLPVLARTEVRHRRLVYPGGLVGVGSSGSLPRRYQGRRRKHNPGGGRRRRGRRRGLGRGRRLGLAPLLLGGVQARPEPRGVGGVLLQPRVQLGVASVERSEIVERARHLARRQLVRVAQIGDLGAKPVQLVMQLLYGAARRAPRRDERNRADCNELASHCVATVARTIKGCQKSGSCFEQRQRDQALTSLNTMTSTLSPMAMDVSPGTTARPSAETIERRIPDPCSPVSRAPQRPRRASSTTLRYPRREPRLTIGASAVAVIVAREIARRPCMARSIGRTNSSKVTIAETGLPGRPNTGRPAMEPNVIGFPGRMSTFQRWSSAPALTSASRTRSSSPTDTPADDTSTSASRPRAMRSEIASSRSGATPRLSGRPPASTTWAMSEYVFAFGICAGVGSVPRSASSLPVESTARMSTRSVGSTRARPRISACACSTDNMREVYNARAMCPRNATA